MTPPLDPTTIARRSFLQQSTYGLGGMALALLADDAAASVATKAAGLPKPDDWHGALKQPHFPVKAKRVIFLCMAGGPSQFETFD